MELSMTVSVFLEIYRQVSVQLATPFFTNCARFIFPSISQLTFRKNQHTVTFCKDRSLPAWHDMYWMLHGLLQLLTCSLLTYLLYTTYLQNSSGCGIPFSLLPEIHQACIGFCQSNIFMVLFFLKTFIQMNRNFSISGNCISYLPNI